MEQQDSLIQGLSRTAALIPRVHVMQDLYLHSQSTESLTEGFMTKFQGTLTSLCSKLLEFNARALLYFEKSSLVQFSRGAVKKDPWTALVQDMKDLEVESRSFTTLLDAANRKSESLEWQKRYEKLENDIMAHSVWQKDTVRDKKVIEFLRMLYTCPYRDRKDRNRDRVPGTCEWFVRHQRFQEWNQSHNSRLLWVSADPGCGKSVLARYLVNEVLPRPSGRTICYFFFKDDFDDQNNATSALSSLIRQLFIALPSLLSNSILEKADTDGDQLIGSFSDLWTILTTITSDPRAGEVVVVFDALDECRDADRSELIEKVTDLYLHPENTRNLKILLTSRPYGHIQSGFRKIERAWPTIHLSGEVGEPAEQIAEEINLVVDDAIEKITEAKDLDDDDHDFLQEELAKIPNRTYLWVTLTLEYIKTTPFRRGNVRRALGEDIPASVNDAYEKMLDRSLDHKRARIVLHIVLGARKPLSLEEVSVALALQSTHECEDDVKEEMESEKTFKSTLRDLCGLLLWINDDKVYLLHQTVKEFLVPRDVVDSNGPTWQDSFPATGSHNILAKRCIWFFQLHILDPRLTVFAGYASDYWEYHFRESCFDKTEDVTMLALKLCDPNSEENRIWQQHDRKRFKSRRSFKRYIDFKRNTNLRIDRVDFPYDTSPFILASRLGLQAVVESLLESQIHDCDTREMKFYRTPLSNAAQAGHENVVKLLLDTRQVDVDSRDAKQRTPFSYAAARGHEGVVHLLLDTGGVDVNSQDEKQRTPLSYAAWLGQEGVVQLLLRIKETEVDSLDSKQRTPLSYAVARGHERVVKLLLDTGQVHVDSQDDTQRTPLSYAAARGNDRVVQLLLDTGQVDVNSQDATHQTPLSYAIREGEVKVIELLQSYKNSAKS